MAESLVQVTEGTGKKLHTWSRTVGANTVEDEYVLLGENALASYVLVGAASTATANSHLICVMAGASLKVRIRRILLWQRTLATVAAYMTLGLYRTTTAGTGGAAVNPSTLEGGDPAAGATGQQLPAAKGTESTQMGSFSVYMMQTAAASAVPPQVLLDLDFDRQRSKALVIPAGVANGIALKNITAVAAGTVDYMIWLDESSF